MAGGRGPHIGTVEGLMGFLQRIFGRPAEARSSGSGYTVQVMAARDSYLSSRAGIGELTGTVQTCVTLWEAAFALADVAGTPLLRRQTMALTARCLALRGEALFLIGPDRLVPASEWDIATRDGQPRAYRLNIPEAGGGRQVTALAPEVLHLRIGVTLTAPWAGSAPLRRAHLTDSLLHAVEPALAETFENAPLGSQIVPLPDGSAEDMEGMRVGFRGRRGATMVLEGVAQATAAGMNPQLGQRREDLSPDLSKSMTAESLDAARATIAAAFGVLPALLNPAATGPAIREAQRHLVLWQLQPIAELLQAEARDKLGGAVVIDVTRPAQAFDTGGRARALQAIVARMIEAKAAGLTDDQMQSARRLVDWNE